MAESFEIEATKGAPTVSEAEDEAPRCLPPWLLIVLRVVLGVCCAVSVIVGIVLVVLGATPKFSAAAAAALIANTTVVNSTAADVMRRDFENEAKLFNNPFAGVAGLGCVIVVWSLAGILGAFLFSPKTEWRRTFATAFSAFSIGIMGAEFFVACSCFVFGRLAVAYVRIYWPYISNSVAPWTMAQTSAYVGNHLNQAGGLTIMIIFIHIAIVLIASTIVGWRHMIRRVQTLLTLGLATGAFALIGVCVWSSQYAPWLDTHGSVWLTWLVAFCAFLVIGIAIVGALTSMCMSEKTKPVEGWIGAVGRYLRTHPCHARIFIVAQIATVLAVVIAMGAMAIAAFTISDKAHAGLEAEVAALEDQAARPGISASDEGHMGTVIASHFALIGCACLMMMFCLLADALYATAYFFCIKTDLSAYDDGGGRGGGIGGLPAHGALEESDGDDDDDVETISFQDEEDDVLGGGRRSA